MKLPHTTRKDSVCSMKDNITKLLGLEDVIVENVYEDADGCHIEMELPRCKHRCPCCGSTTDCVHDYRVQKVKDISTHGVRTYLHIRKRRYACKACGKRFCEENSFLPRYYRVTAPTAAACSRSPATRAAASRSSGQARWTTAIRPPSSSPRRIAPADRKSVV